LKHTLTMVVVTTLLTACNQKQAAPASAAAPALGTVKFDTSLPVNAIMGHVIDPGAFLYWRSTGWEVTKQGTKDLTPTTEDGWENMVSGATIVAEAGNMLQLEGRAWPPEADWNKYSQQLTAQALVARAAADAHDKNAIFAEGAKLYQVCVDCHKQYVIDPLVKEQDKHGGAVHDPLPEWPADVRAKQQAYEAAQAKP
jgi:hypothetical protein